MENHECEGYIPQYDDMTEEREERWEERVRVIREMKRDGWHDETDLEDGREEDYDGGDYCEGPTAISTSSRSVSWRSDRRCSRRCRIRISASSRERRRSAIRRL